MKYSINLLEGQKNCLPESSWVETNNYEILKEEPYNNVLFEHEYEDIQWEDLHEVDGEIQLNEEHYHARKKQAIEDVLRNQRNALLKAFDIYKSNVNYGVEIETQEKHEEMRVWYLAILELDTYAIENPPFKISYYLGV